MRRVGFGGVAAALIVGLGVAAAAAETPDGDSSSATAKSGWWSGWFADKPKPKTKANVEKKAVADDRPAPPHSAEAAVFEQQKQMKAYLRRVEVCMRLRQIADQTGNAELMRQAEELDARAWEVYRLQTARLPVPTPSLQDDAKMDENKPGPLPSAAGKKSSGKQDTGLPAVGPMSSRGDGINSIGGAFGQRERDLINGAFLGGDRP